MFASKHCMALRLLFLYIGLAAAVPHFGIGKRQVAAPSGTSVPTGTQPPDPNACGKIAAATSSALVQNPRATPSVPATLAIACLRSVPNKPEPAQRLIASLKAYVQWQSTLPWLKSPPPSYMLPPVDILGSLDKISTDAAGGRFASEYDFQLAISNLITSAHDGHFAYRGDVFKAFVFRNSLAANIVSVSTDGTSPPKLFHTQQLFSQDRTTGAIIVNQTLPPAITKINGVDAVQFIERSNLVSSPFQDPDSQWNSMMPNYANPSSLLSIAGSSSFQTDQVALVYDNGDLRSAPSVATIRAGVNFTGIRNGEDFYNRFCNPEAATPAPSNGGGRRPPQQQQPAPAPAPAPNANTPIPGYPVPIVRDNGAGVTSGYFLNGTGYEDVAVLAVSGFAPAGAAGAGNYLSNFQTTVQQFLARSSQAQKKRLVIDLTTNGGGFVVAGFELFAQLFPDDPNPFQANNLRASQSLVDMANIVDSLSKNPNQIPSDRTSRLAASLLSGSAVVSNLIPGSAKDPQGALITNTSSILGPVTLLNDRFTAYQSSILNTPAPDFNLTGVGSRASTRPSVFSPESIVLLTDGTCGSTCTIFSYLMILEKDVKTIAFGGRPVTGPMQGVAGVEGAQVFDFSDLAQAAAASIILAPVAASPADQARFNRSDSDLTLLAEGYAIDRALNPASAGAVNGKNAFTKADATTPLQFLFEPANCRSFYTPQMVFGPTEVWKRAVDATWTDPAKFCVEGSRVAMSPDDRLDPMFRMSVMPNGGAPGSFGVPPLPVSSASGGGSGGAASGLNSTSGAGAAGASKFLLIAIVVSALVMVM